MELTKDEIQEWHDIGEQEAKKVDESLFRAPHEPWCGPFESTEHYEARLAAFRAGMEDYGDKKKYG